MSATPTVANIMHLGDADHLLADYPELHKVVVALDWLSFAADPTPGARRLSPFNARSAETPAPGRSTAWVREQQRRTRSKLLTLAESIHSALDREGRPPETVKRRGPTCVECDRGLRFGAQFCDGCGARIEEAE